MMTIKLKRAQTGGRLDHVSVFAGVDEEHLQLAGVLYLTPIEAEAFARVIRTGALALEEVHYVGAHEAEPDEGDSTCPPKT